MRWHLYLRGPQHSHNNDKAGPPVCLHQCLTDWGQLHGISHSQQNTQVNHRQLDNNHYTIKNHQEFVSFIICVIKINVSVTMWRINITNLICLFPLVLYCVILELWCREIINASAESNAGPCIPLQNAIESCSKWCVATTHKQSRRSKSNTPIPHHSTTKVFPAATWYSVRRTCVKMPRPTAGWSFPSFISAIVLHMSVFCFEEIQSPEITAHHRPSNPQSSTGN